MNDKFYSLLGLAARAGKVKTGDTAVMKDIRSQTLRLVIVAGDASENTQKKYNDKSSYYRVPYRITGTREMLGHALGKGERVTVGITDEGFAKKLISLLDN